MRRCGNENSTSESSKWQAGTRHGGVIRWKQTCWCNSSWGSGADGWWGRGNRMGDSWEQLSGPPMLRTIEETHPVGKASHPSTLPFPSTNKKRNQRCLAPWT